MSPNLLPSWRHSLHLDLNNLHLGKELSTRSRGALSKGKVAQGQTNLLTSASSANIDVEIACRNAALLALPLTGEEKAKSNMHYWSECAGEWRWTRIGHNFINSMQAALAQTQGWVVLSGYPGSQRISVIHRSTHSSQSCTRFADVVPRLPCAIGTDSSSSIQGCLCCGS